MNDQANKILAELLQKASNGIDSAVTFSQAQIPDVIHQLLVWQFSVSILFSLLGAVLFVTLQYGGWCGIKYLRKRWKGDDLINHPEIILVAAYWLLTLYPLTWIDLVWLKIWLAPKLYLIEYASQFLK